MLGIDHDEPPPQDEPDKRIRRALAQRDHDLVISIEDLEALYHEGAGGCIELMEAIARDHPASRFAIIATTEHPAWLAGRPGFHGERYAVFDLPPYTKDELAAILATRARLAGVAPALSRDVIPACVTFAVTYWQGDARRAMDVLRSACDDAADRGESRVGFEDVERAFGRIARDRPEEYVQAQPPAAKLMLHALRLSGTLGGALWAHLHARAATRIGQEPLSGVARRAILREWLRVGIVEAWPSTDLERSRWRFAPWWRRRFDEAIESDESYRAMGQAFAASWGGQALATRE